MCGKLVITLWMKKIREIHCYRIIETKATSLPLTHMINTADC